MKTHLKVNGVDARSLGQAEFDYQHQTACGYVRNNVTRNEEEVDCFYCLRSDEMKHYHKINGTFTDPSGCY